MIKFIINFELVICEEHLDSRSLYWVEKFQISFPDTGKDTARFFTTIRFWTNDDSTTIRGLSLQIYNNYIEYNLHLQRKNSKFPFRTPEMGHTHTDIALYMHRFMYRYCTTVRNLKRWTVFLCTELWTAVQLDPTYTHLRCTHCAWISCTAVHLYFSPFSVHSWTVLLCIQLYCTTVHSLVPAWPLFCQPIIKELGFTCFALIGPLSISPATP